jgi:hypothetical protein
MNGVAQSFPLFLWLLRTVITAIRVGTAWIENSARSSAATRRSDLQFKTLAAGGVDNARLGTPSDPSWTALIRASSAHSHGARSLLGTLQRVDENAAVERSQPP